MISYDFPIVFHIFSRKAPFATPYLRQFIGGPIVVSTEANANMPFTLDAHPAMQHAVRFR